MAEERLKHCPTHATPDADVVDAWPCPDDCLDFLEELERRIEDVQVHGNFTRMFVSDGVMFRQKFRNHEPVGEPVEWVGWKVDDGDVEQLG